MSTKSNTPINVDEELDKIFLEGDGIFDWFKPRDTYNNTSSRTLKELGRYPITSITLSRAPIQRILSKMLDFISFGAFSRAQKRYGYDRLYHLSMVVDLDVNGVNRKVVVEKNAVINISSSFKAEAQAEYYPIQMGPQKGKLTLQQMMDNTQKLMGAKYFPYDAFTNNCQNFILSVLKANGLWTQGAEKWLFQPVDELAKDLPGVTKVIARAVTDTGAVVDKLVGNGGGPGSLRKIKPMPKPRKYRVLGGNARGGSMVDKMILKSIQKQLK